MTRAVLRLVCAAAAVHCADAFAPGAQLGFLQHALPTAGVHAGPALGAPLAGGASRRAGLARGLALKAVLVDDTETGASTGSVAPMKATEYFQPLVAGDILESTDEQRKIVYGSYALLAALFAKGLFFLPEMDPLVALETVAAVVVGYEFADFGSGVYHWSMDNYGSAKTPVFGTQIEAFQGHHELPWTITHRQVCNNIYKICQATAPFCIAGLLLEDNAFLLLWASTAIAFINLSQELHKWSHQSRDSTPAWINALQDYNMIVSRKGHLAHHKPPFESNYCIVSGHCNPIADKIGLFRGLEKVVFALTGNKARCETNERLLEGKVVELGIKRKASTTLQR